MLTNWKRVIRSGFVNFWRSGVVSLSSVIVLTVTLFVIGGLLLAQAFLTASLDEIKAIPPPSTPSVDTAGWKTYRNDKYGFEFKYPAVLSFTEFTTPECAFEAAFEEIGEGDVPTRILLCIYKSLIEVRNVLGTQMQWSASTLGGKPSLEAKTGYPILLVELGNGEGLRIDNPVPLPNLDIVKIIKNSFRFVSITSQIDTTNWKTYRNDKYGFEFKYPAGFKLTAGEGDVLPGQKDFVVTVVDELASSKPSFDFSINSPAAISGDKHYELSKNLDNSISIVSTSNPNDGIDSSTMVITGTINNTAYRFGMIYKKGDVNYEPMFKQILSTFRFVK